MTRALFSIRDELTGYGDPFTLPDNDEVAVRMFRQAVNDSKPNRVNQAPQDMVLFKIAYFDEQSGEITPAKKQILRASEVKKDGIS